MRVVKFFILAVILGWCFSTTQVVGNDTGLAQTSADSIIVSNSTFTPNGDGGEENKDFFEVKSKENNPVSLKVYNRFGTLVFSAEDKVCRWYGHSSSGEKLDNGVYFFLAGVRGVSPEITTKGTVTLLDKEDSIIVSNNVFTPNGGQDFFEVISKGNNPVSLKVYNRFGTLVFSAEDKKCRWDGRSSSGQKLDNGVYLFHAEIVGMSPKITKIGDVTLLGKEE